MPGTTLDASDRTRKIKTKSVFFVIYAHSGRLNSILTI